MKKVCNGMYITGSIPKWIHIGDIFFLSDWHGLAELCGIGGEKIPSLQHSGDPSSKVLELWVEHNKHESTIDMLLLFLEDLDRFDIIYDIAPLLGKFFNTKPSKLNVLYWD